MSTYFDIKTAMAGVARMALHLDQDDPAQRRAFVKIMEATGATAKLRPIPVDQPEQPLVADKAKGKGA